MRFNHTSDPLSFDKQKTKNTIRYYNSTQSNSGELQMVIVFKRLIIYQHYEIHDTNVSVKIRIFTMRYHV